MAKRSKKPRSATPQDLDKSLPWDVPPELAGQAQVPEPTFTLWDVPELATRLKISESTVSYLVATSRWPEVETDLPFVRVGERSVRFIPTQIFDYLLKNQNKAYRLKRKPKFSGDKEEMADAT